MAKTKQSPTHDFGDELKPEKSQAFAWAVQHKAESKAEPKPEESRPATDKVVPIESKTEQGDAAAKKPKSDSTKKETKPKGRRVSQSVRGRESLSFVNFSTRVREDILGRIEEERYHRVVGGGGKETHKQYIHDEALHIGLLELESRRKKPKPSDG